MNEAFEIEKTKATQDDTKERQVSSSILDIIEKHGNITTVYLYHSFACWAFLVLFHIAEIYLRKLSTYILHIYSCIIIHY